MLLYFFIVLGIVSLGGIVAIAWRQLAYVRTHSLTDLSVSEEYLGELIQRRIDLFYERFSLFFKHFVHYSYLYFLLAIRRLVVIIRFLLTRVERKFSRLIDAVHGRGVLLGRGGPVSPFLTQIKDHKETAMAGWKGIEQ
jgi:hypothetical protein